MEKLKRQRHRNFISGLFFFGIMAFKITCLAPLAFLIPNRQHMTQDRSLPHKGNFIVLQRVCVAPGGIG